MKYLLVAINSKYIHSNLAVYSLKKYAKEFEDKITIGEYTINNQMDTILNDIYLNKPDVIAFSCYIWNIEYINELISDIKKVNPLVKIWVGGPEVSYRAKEYLLEHREVNIVMSGEGEINFKNLIAEYEKMDINNSDKCTSNVNNIEYINENQQIRYCVKPMDLSDVPFIYEDEHNKISEKFKNKILYYESSRGCPFSCSYCLSSIDKKLRFRNIELVKKELQFFLDNKVPQVKFVDRTFNCDKNHAKEIWKYILEHDNNITNFHFEIAADIITDEELEIIKQMRPGLIQLEIGVQSTNNETVKEIHRTMDFNKAAKIVKEINSYKNIHQHLDLIAGLPYETYEIFKKSFNDVYSLKPDQLQLGFLKVLSGSYMYNHKEDYEAVFRDKPPYEVLKTKWIGFDEIIKLKEIETVVEIYYNSHQFSNVMEVLINEFKDPFTLYSKLANHYKKYTLCNESHSRITRYKILLDFIKENYYKVNYEAYVELAVMDIYLRDNMKTRPEFALDTSKYKNIFKNIYENEYQNHKLLSGYENYTAKQISSMTHIEAFKHDIKKLIKENLVIEKETFIIFDYNNRNPLNQDARTIFLNIDDNII